VAILSTTASAAPALNILMTAISAFGLKCVNRESTYD
jgi:hypothetical protein